MANFKKLSKDIASQMKQSINRELLARYRKEVNKGNALLKIILDLISKGISPVKQGAGRFLKYSKGYINKIKGVAEFQTRSGELVKFKTKKMDKRQSPVNMKDTGEMLDSLNYNPSSGVIGFTDKKAKWHNNGEGRLPIRKLLPDKQGEIFNRRVQQRLKDSMSEAIRKESKSIKNILSIKIKFK